MANWFKIYETDLDETRMRFAMTQIPEVWPVWTRILMECCKHRSDSFKWGEKEQELFGFADSLKISIPIVNKAVSLLCEIEYIQLKGKTLKVLKWNEKQGDYLLRASQGYWKKYRESKKRTVIHGDSHIEERRGEEIRREEKDSERAVELPVGFPKSESVALGICALSAIPKEFVVDCWNKAMSRGGKDAKGVSILSFLHYVSRELKYDVERRSKEGAGATPKPAGQPTSDQRKIIESVQPMQ